MKKADLPVKDCATCGRPFAWRKRWARTWNEVRHCSDACRARRSAGRVTAAATHTAGAGAGVSRTRRPETARARS